MDLFQTTTVKNLAHHKGLNVEKAHAQDVSEEEFDLKWVIPVGHLMCCYVSKGYHVKLSA